MILSPFSSLGGHQAPITCVRFTRDGKYALTASHDRTVRLHNPTRIDSTDSISSSYTVALPPSTSTSTSTSTPTPSSAAPKAFFIKQYGGGHSKEITNITVNSSNSHFATCGGDKSVFLWDVVKGTILRRFEGHSSRVNCLDMNHDGSVLASGGYDSTVCFWDVRASNSFKPIQTLSDFKDSVTALVLPTIVNSNSNSNNNKPSSTPSSTSTFEVVTASVDGFVRTYDLRMGQLRSDDFHSPVTSIAMSSDQNCLAASCLNGKIRLVERSSGVPLSEYTGHKAGNYGLDVSIMCDDITLASGSEDGKVYLYDLVKKTPSQIIAACSPLAPKKAVCSLATHPKKKILLAATASEVICYT